MSNIVTSRNQIIPTVARSIAAAAALCCAGLASAQSSVTVYGIVDAAVMYTTNQQLAAGKPATGSKTVLDAGQLATSRWGFKGTEDLGGGLKANFALESTLANDTGAGGSSYGGGFVQAGTTASLFDRISTVGLSGGFGSVNLGRQNMLGVDSIGLADPIGLADAPNNPNVVYSALNGGAFGGGYGTNGGGTELRQNNSIKYVSPVMSGFIGAAMYGFGEQPGNTAASSYAAVSGVFTDGKSGIALAYAKLKDATDASSLTLIGGGAKYVMSPVTFNATYAQSKVDGTSASATATNRKIAVTGLGVDYALSPALTLTGAYYNTKQSGSVLGDGKADQFIAMGKYALSKRTIAYASLTYVKAGSATIPDQMMSAGFIGAGSDSSTATRTAVGILHSF